MLNGHLSDEQIQELALGNTSLPPQLAAHAEGCADCKTKIENYRLLISAVEMQAAPSFDFDLAAAVTAQIESAPTKAINRGWWWLCAATIVVIMTGAVIYMGDYMTEFANGLRSLSIYFVAISVLALIVVLVIDQFKSFHRKMKLLDTP